MFFSKNTICRLYFYKTLHVRFTLKLYRWNLFIKVCKFKGWVVLWAIKGYCSCNIDITNFLLKLFSFISKKNKTNCIISSLKKSTDITNGFIAIPLSGIRLREWFVYVAYLIAADVNFNDNKKSKVKFMCPVKFYFV